MRVPSDVDRLAGVRAFVREAVADFGGSKRVADDLVQAVDEATCNVMLHGYGGSPGEVVDLLVVFEPGGQLTLRSAFTYVDPSP